MSLKITRALPELVENDIITDEIAQNIKAHYEKHNINDSNRLVTIFGILGATLVGLGIILIMAHNWDHFPRIIKVMLAFLPMLVGQAILGFSIVKSKSTAWKEAATVFLFLSVGVCIASVSQIYHISGDLESFLLAWVVLCTPLIYVTKSTSAIILHLIFITYYTFEANFGVRTGSLAPLYYLILLAIPIPRYIQLLKSNVKSPALIAFHWLFPLSLMLALPLFIGSAYFTGLLIYILLYGLFYNIGKHSYFKNASLWQNGYLFLGAIGTIFLLFAASSRMAWRMLQYANKFDTNEILICLILLAAICFVLYRNSRTTTFIKGDLFQYIFFIFGIIFFISNESGVIATLMINILIFAIGLMLIKTGADNVHFGYLNSGMLVLAVLIAFRFYDTNISFELRGLLFVLIGGGFFAANYIKLKKQKTRNNSKT
ncbi:DUF2157 domain-containing protein [uncultured Kordia sp.]|uniref:DUF2157 domain-containing protein n=1 Tax=uncultured Kordia sp. TaxID=507699 RepID=UPI00260B89E9|nr:DUF2157 domain-containing protein [uncultured Kordia sp.]